VVSPFPYLLRSFSYRPLNLPTRRQRGRYGNEQRTQRATVPPYLTARPFASSIPNTSPIPFPALWPFVPSVVKKQTSLGPSDASG